MLDQAIWAEEHAVSGIIRISTTIQLAHYLLIQGETERAVKKFRWLFARNPDLASSSIEGSHIRRGSGSSSGDRGTDDLVTRFDLAVYAGITQAAQMALALPEETLSVEMQQRIDAASGMDGWVCERCFLAQG